MRSGARMSGATGNLGVGLHEFVDMAFVVHFLREGDLFLDIGANVGSFTVLAAGVARARSFAFEPIADTARDLRRNIAVVNFGKPGQCPRARRSASATARSR